MSELAKNSIQTPLKRVRGLGTARSGTGHFWRQRMTALANVPLTIAFVVIVLIALGIIVKQKKDIIWKGLPTSNADEVAVLETETERRRAADDGAERRRSARPRPGGDVQDGGGGSQS